MNPCLKYAAFLFIFGATVPCQAQTQTILTWTDCVARAKEKNPDLIAAERNYEAGRAGYKESFNGILPSVDLSNTYTRFKGDTRDDNLWSARGSASLDLFNMTRYSNISFSHSSMDAAQAGFLVASSNVLLSLRRAFASLLYTQQQITVSQTVLAIRKNNASLVSLRYDSGRESKGNKLRAQAELLQAEADLNQAQRDYKAAQQELNRQLGEESFDVLIATGVLATNSSADMSTPLIPIVDNHPTVEQSAASLRGAQASLAQARSVLWPSLSANYTYLMAGRDEFPNDTTGWTASGVLSLPIFGGGITSAYYSVSQAKRHREQAEESLRSTRYQVRSTLESSLSNFAGAIDQVKVQQAFLQASRQRNQEADIRYSNGLMSFEDWELIVTERVGFERTVIQAERAAVFAEAEWDNARGKGLGDLQ